MQKTIDNDGSEVVMGRALAKSEAAARIGTSERTLDRLIESGKLRACRVGVRRVRIFEVDLNEYLRTVETRPAAQPVAMGVVPQC